MVVTNISPIRGYVYCNGWPVVHLLVISIIHNFMGILETLLMIGVSVVCFVKLWY